MGSPYVVEKREQSLCVRVVEVDQRDVGEIRDLVTQYTIRRGYVKRRRALLLPGMIEN